MEEFERFKNGWVNTILNINKSNPFLTIFLGDFNARNTLWWSGDVINSEGLELNELSYYYNLHTPAYDELSWIKDYLFRRTQVVEHENKRSDSFMLMTGVPQGSILGPLLFLLYFNDFVDCLDKAKVVMQTTQLYTSQAQISSSSKTHYKPKLNTYLHT